MMHNTQPSIEFSTNQYRFEVTANGNRPILSQGLGAGTFDAREGDSEVVPTEIVSLDLSSSNTLEIGCGLFDVFIDLYLLDPVIPGEMTFLTTSLSPDGTSAEGELKGAFNFIFEVGLTNIDDPSIIEPFLHSGMIELNGSWPSEDRQLVFDDPIMVSGMLQETVARADTGFTAADDGRAWPVSRRRRVG
jgi:hypothetical protein